MNLLFLTALALTLGSASPSSPPPPDQAAASASPPGIRVLSDVALPSAFEWAVDVRWASDKSVYLGVSVEGAFRVNLDPKEAPPQEMFPGRSKPGGFWASQKLAASSTHLVAAGPAMSLTWRRLEEPFREEVPFDSIQAIDLEGNRFAIVGARRDDKGGYGTDGAIAWIGTLENRLADLRPILYDVKGPGLPTMNRCGSASIGAVRFLPGGSLVVIPGIQPGVNLYDVGGKLIRTWDSPTLGIDADCLGLTEERWRYLWGHPQERQVWFNQHRMVDTVLPFKEGPGLVVRRVEEGRTRWDLKLLRLDGPVETYAIPIEGANEFFNLEGDLRAGKIVFLLHEVLFYGGDTTRPTPPRLIVASPPEGLAN